MFPALFGRIQKLHPTLRAGFILFGLLILMFGDVLIGQQKLLSLLGTDLSSQFAYWRWAGFAQLKAGSMPLWNPYAFSGMPFQASFQTALFYPVNWVHLVLPPILALNWEMVLNIFVAGLGMYIWAARSGRSFAASVLAGALLMFGMPYMLRITAGHMAPLGAMAWIPWIFAAADDVLDRPSLRGLLRGAAACALQFLAGHPQTAFTTGLAVGTYCVLRLAASLRGQGSGARPRLKPALLRAVSLAAFGGAGVALAAIQLLPSLAILPETLRSHAAYDFVASFSFPPENFLTWLAPSLFGDIAHVDYWGRCYLWEMSVFFGIFGLLFALCGLYVDKGRRWIWAGTLAVLFLLSLGGHTPLLRILYDHVPPFDRLRSNSKFTIPAAVILCFLSASGYDALQSKMARAEATAWTRRVCVGLGAAALLFAVAAVCIPRSGGLWGRVLLAISATQESYVAPARYADPAFIAQTAQGAALSLGIAAATLAAFAALLWGLRTRPRFFSVFAVLAIAEVFAQAAYVRASFSVESWYPRAQQDFAQAQMKDQRILDLTGSNCWMLLKKNAAWGYDPFLLRRYAEVMAVSQGVSPDDAGYDVPISSYNPLMKMLRCEFVAANIGGQTQYGQLPPGMPHLQLMGRYRVLPDRKAMMAALADAKFDPAREVLLEEKPALGEVRPGPGTVKLLSETTDSLEIEADLKTPQILLITDVYAKGWRAQSLDGSSQKAYQLLPADWTLRAVPLQAGHHRIRVFYDPAGWRKGVWISLASLVLLGVAWIWVLRVEGRRNREAHDSSIEPGAADSQAL